MAIKTTPPPDFGDQGMAFGDKLRSWKRWVWVLSTLLPIVVQVLTKEVGWPEAVVAALGVAMGGLGVIGWEDVTRLKAGAVRAQVAPPGSVVVSPAPLAGPPSSSSGGS